MPGNFIPTGVEFIAKNLGKYLGDLTKADKAQTALGKSAYSVGSAFTGLGDSILGFGANAAAVAGTAGVAGLAAGIAGLGAGIGISISQAANLDDQLAQIAATMGKTKAEVQPLKEEILALSINPNLKVSATEAADAVELLARNGLNMTQILGGAAESTVALANATGADFGTAADISTDVMAQFNKTAGEMGTVIDGITGVTTNSKFTIDDYGLAIAQAGGVASGYGVTLEDFNTVLAATSSNFKSGSDAGTSFKSFLSRLVNPTAEMQAVMDEYGISLFDAEGNMRSMTDIVGQLNTVFNGTVTTTATVGGATKEMTAAAGAAEKNLTKLTNTIGEQETKLSILQDEYALQIQYYGEDATKSRNLALQIQKLNNDLSENRATLAGYQSDISAVSDAKAQTVTTTKKLTEAERANLAAVLGGADASRTILGLAELTADEYAALSDKVNASGQAFDSAATRVDSLKGAYEVFKSIVSGNAILIGDALLPIVRQLTEAFTQLATNVGPVVVGAFEEIGTRVEKAIDAFGMLNSFTGQVALLQAIGLSPEQIGEVQPALKKIVSSVTDAFAGGGITAAFSALGGGIADSLGITPQFSELIGKVSASIQSVAGIITGSLTPALSGLTAGGIIDAINQGIVFVNQNFEAFSGAIVGIGAVLATGVFAALGAGIVSLATPINLIIVAAAALGAAWAGNWFDIQGIVQQAYDVISAVVLSIANAVLPPLMASFDNITAALSAMGLDWTDVWNALSGAVIVVAEVIGVTIVGIIAIVTSLVAGIAEGLATATSYWVAFENAISMVIQGAVMELQGFIAIFQGIMAGDWTQISQGFVLVWEGLLTSFQGIFDGLVTIITSSFDTIYTIFDTFFNTGVEIFQNLSDVLVGNSIVPDMMDSILGYFTALPNAIVSALGGLTETVGGIFSSLFGGGDEQSTTGPTFDFASTLPDVDALNAAVVILDTSITNIATVTTPLLLAQMTVVTTTILAQIVLVNQSVLTIDLALINIATVTLPLLLAQTTITATTMITVFTQVNGILSAMLALITQITAAFAAMGAAAQEAGETIVDAMEEATKALEEQKDTIDQLIEYYDKLKAAAEAAAQAAKDVASAGSSGGGPGAAHGLGFAGGTLGFMVPPGFPNDSFPIRVTSGEEILVAPRSSSIEQVIAQRLAGRGSTINNTRTNESHITQNIYTQAAPQGIIQQLEVAKALIG